MSDIGKNASKNRRWVLASYPEGLPMLDNWRLETSPVPEPGPGEILVRTSFLSVDPYMRGRIAPGKNYTQGVGLGELMVGGGVGEVVASRHPAWKEGDIAEAMNFGWQEWVVLRPGQSGVLAVNRIDPALAPIQSSLSWLGMPGMAAYFGLIEVGRPKPGDTVVVSAASGAVGQIVGQLARLAGARTVAVAGGPDKLSWCRELGYDATVDYKAETDLEAAMRRACSDGVDVFFDNTAGPIHDAVMPNLAVGARIVICGRIALADQFGKPDIGPRFLSQFIVSRPSMHGFVVFDWWHRRDEALKRLAALHRAGKLRFKEDVIDGIERVPEAFIRLFRGENFGKQLVRVRV
ncbi:NADP-dependent oxidoreductase [Bosea sp. F3-2]|uniref:NADP-dependent oxidoreductase n=1 Tax=Bosea sp. F3-2 TaxID=2599640 RepID=UPI0011EC81CC|nr:NADP-dependent oxidoreductase [Bosea sp. F3-2]QEL23697.1 NADP-dependent oxidoreductase [Bosea sp. F3-2]